MRARSSFSGLLVFAALASSILLCAPSSAWAQRKTIGNFNDWTAFVDGKGANRICYIGSVPKKAEGNYTRRGDTYILVSHRPTERVFGEVSLEAGYTYKQGSEVAVDIDGKTFKLFTKGGNAWAEDADGDKALIAAMRAGSRLVAKGTSNRDTLTTDTYSLTGFSAAYNAINKACDAR
jgi:invasion protein IalB